MNHIELFAGCGGLSLGLESEGFEMVLANELSPMAAETFAFNHLGEDLTEDLAKNSKVFWLNSRFERESVSQRLREEPLIKGPIRKSDVEFLNSKNIVGSLLVGSIVDLNKLLKKNDELLSSLVEREIDLVSGGPPCQSFSLAGLREKDSEKNKLPWEFAKFVDLVKPKIALLENVTGILRPFVENGVKFHAWFEVSKAFAKVGYVPVCLHVNAKYAGVAQNRPRFILLALRQDVAEGLITKVDPLLKVALSGGMKFLERVKSRKRVKFEELKFYDVENDPELFSGPVFRSLASSNPISTVKDAIADLAGQRTPAGAYVKRINKIVEKRRPLNKQVNHDLRTNNNLVQARFRLYQIMNLLSKEHSKEISSFLRDPENSSLSAGCLDALGEHMVLGIEGEFKFLLTKEEKIAYLSALRTKKQTQRALIPDKPAPAALSIADDACHWEKSLTRTLTVREMARIQSFPDWFVFRSKVTTGGRMRRFEVPQYTQVGNAVPPLLGKALGKVVNSLLQNSED